MNAQKNKRVEAVFVYGAGDGMAKMIMANIRWSELRNSAAAA